MPVHGRGQFFPNRLEGLTIGPTWPTSIIPFPAFLVPPSFADIGRIIGFPSFPPAGPFEGGQQVGPPPDQIEVNGRVFVDGNPGDVAANITTGTHSVGASAQLPVIAGSREDPNGPAIPKTPRGLCCPESRGFAVRRSAFAVESRDNLARANFARAVAA